MDKNDFRRAAGSVGGQMPFLKAGMIVSYYIEPNNVIVRDDDVGSEPCGHLRGMVITCKGLLASGVNQVLVCPIVPVDDDNVPHTPYTIPYPNGRHVFRPELITSIEIKSLRPEMVGRDTNICSEEVLQEIRGGFCELIKPIVPEGASKRMIGKGMLSWFTSLPHGGDFKVFAGATPAIALTPRAVAEQTGLVTLSRLYSNWNNFNPAYHTKILIGGYRPSYAGAAVLTVSIDRLKKREGVPVKVLRQTMVELCDRVTAKMDDKIFARMIEENPINRKGAVPEDVARALRQWDDRAKSNFGVYRR